MRRRLIAMALPGLALAGCVSGAMRANHYPIAGYLCRVEYAGPDGEVTLFRSLNVDGAPMGWVGDWKQRVGTVALTAIWVGRSEPDLDDAMRVNVTVYRAPGGPSRKTGHVTIAFQRESEGPILLTRPVQLYNGDSYGTGTTIGEIRAATGGRPVALVVKDRRGREIARGVLDPAMLDRGKPMVDRARAEVEAMTGDYRNRCTPTYDNIPGDIVIA